MEAQKLPLGISKLHSAARVPVLILAKIESDYGIDAVRLCLIQIIGDAENLGILPTPGELHEHVYFLKASSFSIHGSKNSFVPGRYNYVLSSLLEKKIAVEDLEPIAGSYKKKTVIRLTKRGRSILNQIDLHKTT